MDEEYIKYGDKEISYNDFLKQINDNVQSYLDNKLWTDRTKKKFFNVYLNIVESGISSADDNNIYTSKQINLDALSPTELGLYGDAAYYILSLLQNSPSRKKEEKKEAVQSTDTPLPKYKLDNLLTFINNKVFGGQDPSKLGERWHSLDTARDEATGKLSTENRRNILADMLESFSGKLDSYDFTDSAFDNKEEALLNITRAITSLRNNDENLNRNLNAIGLNPLTWLNNGLLDLVTIKDLNGNLANITAQLYYSSKLPTKEEEKKEELKKDSKTLTIGYRTLHTIPSSKLSPNSGWRNIFLNTDNRGVLNINNDEAAKIGDFIKTYGETIEKGQYSGGKHLIEFPNLVVFNDRLYHLTDDKTKAKRIQDLYLASKNAYLGKSRKTLVDLKLEFPTILGKLLKFKEDSKFYGTGYYTKGIPSYSIRLGEFYEEINPNSPTFSKDIKKAVANLIKSNKMSLTTEEIKDLKSKGWLKHGGTINKPVNLIISEFLSKQK